MQSNLNSSNADGSFTMPNSNSFLGPYEILPTAEEHPPATPPPPPPHQKKKKKKKKKKKNSYFVILYVLCTR